MKIYDELEQKSEEWLKVRLGKFGSTDAQAVAAGGGGLTTRVFEKVAELIIGQPKAHYTNADMERGIELEPMARSAYEIETGNAVKQVGYIELDSCVGGSPDGLVGDDGLVEIKCPSNTNFIRFAFTRKIKSAYVWQMQHLMYISDRKWCDFVAFNEKLDRIIIIRVERDEAKIEKIRIGLESGIEKLKEVLMECKK